MKGRRKGGRKERWKVLGKREREKGPNILTLVVKSLLVLPVSNVLKLYDNSLKEKLLFTVINMESGPQRFF